MHGTSTRTRGSNARTPKNRPSSEVSAPAGVKTPFARPADDELMLLPEIADYTRRTEATLRYLRHLGGDDAPPLWRQGRRLVAWKSEINYWLDKQRAANQ